MPSGLARNAAAPPCAAMVLLLLVLPSAALAVGDGQVPIPDDSQLEASGAIVGRIIIDNQNVFNRADASDDKPFYRFADRLHITTRESVIRHELLFAEGDRYSHRLLEESARLLRSKVYFFDARITPLAYHDGQVDLKVTTKDVWTLDPGVNFERSGGADNSGVDLEELNLLGSGVAVDLGRSTTVDRTQTLLNVADNNVAGSRVLVNATYSNNSDGSVRSLDLGRPFYALDTHWAAGTTDWDYTRTDSLYDQGAVIDQFREHDRNFQAYAGWSPGLKNGWVERFSLGATHNERRFETVPDAIGSSRLPADRRLVYPWLEFDLLQDKYLPFQNHDQIARTEDFYLGAHLSAQLGIAEPAFGSDRRALIVASSVGIGAVPIPAETVLYSAKFSGRIEGGTLRNGLLDAQVRWYFEESHHWLSFATVDETLGHNLDLDNQILLGGDSGLRGYPLRYQDGTARLAVTVEQRYFSDWYPFRLLRVGGAVFADAGRIWGQPPLAAPNLGVLSDLGFGLRLGNSRLGFGNVIHIDLAFPLNSGPSMSKVQFLVQTEARF